MMEEMKFIKHVVEEKTWGLRVEENKNYKSKSLSVEGPKVIKPMGSIDIQAFACLSSA